MCDYSLHSVRNRLAREGEELVVHRFVTGSIGMAPEVEVYPARKPEQPRTFWAAVKEFFNPDPADQICAVCLPPGARLMLRDIPESIQKSCETGPEEEVVFTQLTASAFTYRDAVRFPGGRELRLQALKEGQRVRVLSLSCDEETGSARQEAREIEELV
jgi:hypothetical protein